MSHDPSGQRRSRGVPLGVTVALLLALGFAGSIWATNRTPAHLPRILGTLVPVAVGLVLGLRAPSQGGRLAWLAGGAAVALGAWLLVPTLGGRNLWSAWREAQRQAEGLTHHDPADVEGFFAAAGLREELAEQFPGLRTQLHQAEADWGRRAAQRITAALEKLPPEDSPTYRETRHNAELLGQHFPELDPELRDAAAAWGQRSGEALVRQLDALAPGDRDGLTRLRSPASALVEIFPSWRDRLAEAERNWAGRTTLAALRQAEPLQRQDPVRAARDLRQVARDLEELNLSDFPKTLTPSRRTALLAVFDGLRREAQALALARRYQAAAEVLRRADQDWGPEAKSLGLGDEFEKLREGYAFLADLARQAGRADPR